MGASEFFFYLFAAMILVFGALTVTSKKIFRSAIYLLFTLINIAALYFYLDYEFIAAVQIVVYVGGIVVLILFALFLTHQAADDLPAAPVSRMFFSLLACLFGLGFAYTLLLMHQFPDRVAAPASLTVAYLGKQMLNYGSGGFVLPFEVVSILLLAAMVGCIAIALRTRKNA
ncbi:MAG TPA: NADH-quinone oxidoreductase subunit J [Bacteroidia bacterium]